MLLSRSLQGAIAFQMNPGGAGNGTATGGFVDTISLIAICVHADPVVGSDNL
jgi:hypothetical protein